MRKIYVLLISMCGVLFGAMSCSASKTSNPYESFMAGERVTDKGMSISDYVGERTNYEHFYIQSQSASDKALVVQCDTAESKYVIIHFEDGQFVEKCSYGKAASGAVYLYEDSYLIWDGETACGCSAIDIWKLNGNYEPFFLGTFCFTHQADCPEEKEVLLNGYMEVEEIIKQVENEEV